jgi:retron-type reverse transcriptase
MEYCFWFGLLPLAGLFVLGWIFWIVRTALKITNGRPWEWLRARRGRGKSIRQLADRLGVSVDEIRAIEASYREIFIPKRRGGQRRLLIPDPPLKAMQRRVLRRLLGRLRAHPAAHGFERGRSIVTNASPHAGRCIVIKIDLVDFFPSTTATRLDAYLRRIGWDAESAAQLVRISTVDGSLPQGAPTSPRLSNLVNFMMDSTIARFVAGRKGIYTRYADDITISFPKDYPRRIRGAIQKVRYIVKRFGYEIHLRGKLQILRGHQQHRVTGLVVNQHVQLPRKTRRWLRAVEHRMKTKDSATLTPQQLAGWRALQTMIETQAPRKKADECR